LQIYTVQRDNDILSRHVYGKNIAVYVVPIRLSLWLIGTVRTQPETVISRTWVQSPEQAE